MTIVEYKPEEISYDSPFSVAASILDLAKLHLYRYYYDVLKPSFVLDEIELLMADTDSLIAYCRADQRIKCSSHDNCYLY